MISTIDILFYISVLAQLIKVGDLFLLEPQKAKVQQICETIDHWLQIFRPMNWYHKLATPRARYSLVFLTTLFYFLISILGVFLVLNEGKDIFFIYLMWLIIMLVAMIPGAYFYYRFMPRLVPCMIKWLLGDGQIFQFIGRFLILHIGFCIIALFPIFLVTYLWSFVEPYPLLVPLLILVGILILWPIYLSINIIFFISFIVAIFSIVTGVLEILMKILRGLAKRVVLYAKGAFAALLIITTTVLGVFSLYLKGNV